MMARIRTIKPDFFRHEGLQDLESANPGAHVMLTFAALWGHCDRFGVFQWRPRTLKLDILPFLDFDLEETLSILAESGLIIQYESDGELYGQVINFDKHQRITGKEATEESRFPLPDNIEESKGKQSGNNGETTGKQSGSQEGKGRERKRKGRECTLAEYLQNCKDENRKAVPEDSRPFAYAKKAGLDPLWLRLAWAEFKERHTSSRGDKKYRDWLHAFENSIRGNWYNLWRISGDNKYLTTQGEQALAFHKENGTI